MLELIVELEFTCDHCGDPLGVKLHCAGQGLAEENAVAQVTVPCPHCHIINQVCFIPDEGEVLDVSAERLRLRIPEPSCN